MAPLPAALAFALVLGVAPPAPADTGIVLFQIGELHVHAASGHANQITVSGGQGVWTVGDIAPITAGTGCAQAGPTTVTCTGDLSRVYVNTHDLDDTVLVTVPSARQMVNGGDGNDRITVQQADAGVLWGGAGDDTLTGGRGDDYLYGELGADVMAGGAGVDTVSYWDRAESVTADLDGRPRDDGVSGESDTIKTDVEGIEGGRAIDYLVGNDGPNQLWGNAGADLLYGFGGDDRLEEGSTNWAEGGGELSGGAGDDVLIGSVGTDKLRGGAGVDDISGGLGADVIHGDGGDDVLRGDAGYDRIYGDLGVNTCVPGPDGASLHDCQIVA
jgi:Ca2+-binding RTX toxin-like protein